MAGFRCNRSPSNVIRASGQLARSWSRVFIESTKEFFIAKNFVPLIEKKQSAKNHIKNYCPHYDALLPIQPRGDFNQSSKTRTKATRPHDPADNMIQYKR